MQARIQFWVLFISQGGWPFDMTDLPMKKYRLSKKFVFTHFNHLTIHIYSIFNVTFCMHTAAPNTVISYTLVITALLSVLIIHTRMRCQMFKQVRMYRRTFRKHRRFSRNMRLIFKVN